MLPFFLFASELNLCAAKAVLGSQGYFPAGKQVEGGGGDTGG